MYVFMCLSMYIMVYVHGFKENNLKKTRMEFPKYPCDVSHCRVPFNGLGDNNASSLRELCNKRKMMHQENKKKQLSKVCTRGHWKPSEDFKLKELVGVFGPKKWNHIARKMQGRTGKQKPVTFLFSLVYSSGF